MIALYRLFLRLVPASFRNEYGEGMADVLAQRLRRAASPIARILVFLDAVADLVGSAIRIHGDLLWQDLRYASRTLGRTPGFAITVIAVTALGVGANTAVFTVTDHVLLRPLPFPEADRLVKIWQSFPSYSQMEFSPPNYRDFTERSRSFESVGTYYELTANLVGQGIPKHVRGALITPEVFSVLGTPPAIGRSFETNEGSGDVNTVILSHGLWQEQFGGDTGVLGQKVSLDGEPYEVVGVMPSSFHFPVRETEYWRPLFLSPGYFEDRNNNMLNVVARMRADVTVEQAQSEAKRIAAQLAKEFPEENTNSGINVIPMRGEISSRSRVLLWALMGASLCVLLIACMNVANLFIVKASARNRELSVRSALGAGRERLVRQLLTESSMLAVSGGACGILLAYATLPLLATLNPARLPIGKPVLDIRVLAFSIALILLTSIAFGVFPALRASSSAAADGLREGSRGGVGGRKEKFRMVLVVAEITMSVVLLVAAGLLLQALMQLRHLDPGFRTEGVLTMRTVLPTPAYSSTARRKQFYARVIEETKQLPGIRSAAYISYLPMTMTGGIWPVNIDGKTVQRGGGNTASLRFVTPGFFETMDIPILRGRDISSGDSLDTPFVAVVSESIVNRYWPGEDPIGQEFEFGFAKRRIVGVVKDIRVRGLEQSSEPQVYLPADQQPNDSLEFYAPKDLAICCTQDPASLIPALRRIVRNADPEQAVANARTMSEIVDAETESRLLQLRILGAFAFLALLLAGVGIHGLLSFTVSQRTPEIGVRMALGASANRILGMVMQQSAVMALVGVVLGAALGYMAGRSLEALLAGIEPASPLPYVCAVFTGLGMAIAGSFLPAIRAIRVDPVSVIRIE